jgi:hypothetical protein
MLKKSLKRKSVSKSTKRKSKSTKRKSKSTKRKSKSTKRKSKSTKRKSKSTKRKSSSKSNHQYYKLYKSSNKTKKYDIYLPKNGRTKKVSFGAKGMSDYTKHKDIERRSRYRSRHSKDRINDPYAPGFWSWYVLWGESSNLKIALAKAVAKAKKLVK